ncbi:IclR family transcriptional regulator [Bordetella genomosp. 13]|uniref:IclR family transcriptional regulator n=1 Tax=Bordetella genomosp. 13 TaxID=463040 RepID=UPI00119EB0B7|nr:IclR family transcriptional regulator [Bordetella genomosp. 13]
MKRSESPPPAADADNGTVNRVLRILARFAEKDRWGLNELARSLNLPRGTTHRLLNLCKPLNFVTQDEEGQYMPGIELHRLAGRLAAEIPINQIGDPILQALRDQTDETVLLTLLVRNELKMFFTGSASPAHPLRYRIEKNQLATLAWGSAGRSLLAFLSEEEIDVVVQRAEPSPLDQRPLDKDELLSALRAIRERGYAASFSERAPGAFGLSVPFFDRQGEIRGNLTLTIPDFRYDPAKQEALIALLRDAAATLTRQLGWS